VDPEIKVVAFDVDGTLYGKWSYLWRMTLSGFPDPLLAWAYNRARIRYREVQGTDPVLPETREGYLRRLSLLMLNVLGRKPSEKAIARITRRVERQMYHRWAVLYRSVHGRKGMRSAVEELHRMGYRIAILSDFPLVEKLKALGIAPWVDVALSSEDIGYLKPDGRVFSRLLDAIGVPAGQVLYVGDSYHKDVLGAKGAGMHTVLLSRGRRSVYPEAEYVVHSFQRLISLFR
jgi:putative hydrolase of the HAD superfamily